MNSQDETLDTVGAAAGPLPKDVDLRVVRILEEYFVALENGEHPDREEFLTRHPEIAAELAACLDGLELVHSVGPQLKEGSADGTRHPGPETRPPLALGDYRIVREVGRGGMGVVYEAEQLSLGRRVALKVLPFAAVLDNRQLQRFKNEAQAAAQLHHTNILPVHAVGCERGVHFYAMQFVEGPTLGDVIAELKGSRDRGIKGRRD